MATGEGGRGAEVVCEFFGIEITTTNPKVAKFLTSDVSEVMNTEIVLRRSGNDSQSSTEIPQMTTDPVVECPDEE